MKKIIFLFVLLASMTASATVTVTPLDVNYNTKTVTFSVSWTGSAANNRVWVWIDFCPVSGVTPQSFSTATITSPIKTGGNGTITGLNGRGFFIEHGATNAGTTVTATLSNAPVGKFNWCAYGSDYPPNAKDNSSGGYTLRGTPPFLINGSIVWSANTYSGSVITALTDATGCPGVWCGRDGEAPGLLNCCAYGTTNCSGTCKTNTTYSIDGACSGACNKRYRYSYNQCGLNGTSEITDNNCADGCSPTYSSDCTWQKQEHYCQQCSYPSREDGAKCCAGYKYQYMLVIGESGACTPAYRLICCN
jgi:hypothetical protein